MCNQPSMKQPKTFNRVFTKCGLYALSFFFGIVQATHAATSNGMGLVPCDGPECDINSVMQLINNIINFFFNTLLLPLFVVMVIYLGVSYFMAGGKPGQHAKLGSMAKHMVLGLVLMMCAFVIVKTLLVVLGFSDTLGFFG